MFGSVCLFCLKDFWSRSKLLHHVCFRSAKCGVYWSSFDDLPIDVFVKAEAETLLHIKSLAKRELGPLHSDFPPVRLLGPCVCNCS